MFVAQIVIPYSRLSVGGLEGVGDPAGDNVHAWVSPQVLLLRTDLLCLRREPIHVGSLRVVQLGESSPVWLAGKVCFVYVDVFKPHVAVRAEHLASSGSHSAAHSSPDPGTGLSTVCGYLQSRLIFMPQWKAYTGCVYHSVIAAEAIIAMLHFPAGQVFQNNFFNIPR